ncbi:MAG: penicillin-binding protein 1A [Pseudomonadota bacterium]|mgnify:CR=1 FL=1
MSDDLIDVVGEPLTAPKRSLSSAIGKLPLPAKIVGGVLAAGVLLSILAVGAFSIYLFSLSQDLPDYEVLANYEPPVTTRVYGNDGSLVAEFARERRLFVPIEAMPELLKDAFISAEDKNFYEHEGLDFKGIVRAQVSNIGNLIRGRRLEGGSTITQQVAKNFLLSSEQKIERKMKEWLVTRRIEKAFTKEHILELYLNEIYLGNRSYGVAAAALNYFDKSLDELTVEEAAYLAAIPKGPSNYHPVNNYDRAVERRNWVIGRLYEDGKIDKDAMTAAQAQPLTAHIAQPLGARDWASEYFAEEVRKQVAERYGSDALYDGGLAVRTTIDPQFQKAAGDALRRWLVEYDQRHGWRGAISSMAVTDAWAAELAEVEKTLSSNKRLSADLDPWKPALVLDAKGKIAKIGFADGSEGAIALDDMKWARSFKSVDSLGAELTSVGQALKRGDVVYVEALKKEGAYALRQPPAVNGALVAMDPHTGRVLAMVGGFSFQLSEFNRAIQAKRQPGSTFKPFVYATALDSGYTPSSIVLDAPFVAPSVDSWWKPGNYAEGRFYGESTLRLGIEQSRNTMTARLAQDIGIGRIVDYVSKFNLSDNLPRELAISLGSGETTLMRITSAYATFVNGGKHIDPFLIDRVQDRQGKTIFVNDKRACPDCGDVAWSDQAEPQLADDREQIMDPRTAYQIVSLLEGAVARGTGSAVKKVVDKPIAGKTGTTNDYKDAWFVGFSPDLAAGVFVGFDMPQPLGQGEAGGRVAAPIFGDFMAAALKDQPGVPFRIPSGIRLVRVNAKTGRPAGPGDGNVILEAFKAEDNLITGPGNDELDLDPLSATPTAPSNDAVQSSVDDLNGLY